MQSKERLFRAGDHEYRLFGRVVRTAMLKEEWDSLVTDPQALIDELKAQPLRADIFSFMQNPPHFAPVFKYRMDWDNMAAIPIKTYQEWWEKQITQEARNKVRKAVKRGVTVRTVAFSDDLVWGIKGVYDDIETRQDTKFTDYRLPFEKVKEGNETFLDRAEFLGAFFGDELIGFIKLVYARGFARVMGIIGKHSHRDKAPMSLLVAKAVEKCVQKDVPYLRYGKMVYGNKGMDSLSKFKRDLGFRKWDLPRYYIPLNPWGRFLLAVHLHKRFKDLLPPWVIKSGLKIRHRIHVLRHGSH